MTTETTTTVSTTVTEAATTNLGLERTAAGRPHPGRPAAFLAELFGAHAPMVLGVCRGLLRDRHEAEDAAQQAFLSAYASLLSGTVPREPAAWLATIARNECRTRAQRRMREPLPVADTQETLVDPSASAADVESLRLALAQLPGQQRRAFLLREFSGLSYAELAVALGVSRPAVESLLFRARQQLRGTLRAVAAASFSAPASMRDFISQLFAGPADGSGVATAAKLGSLPFAAKLASIGAGTALMTAGAVAVAPGSHHHQQRTAARQRLHVVRRHPQARPASPPAASLLAAAHRSSAASSSPRQMPIARTSIHQEHDGASQSNERDHIVSKPGGSDDTSISGHGDESGSASAGQGEFEPADTADDGSKSGGLRRDSGDSSGDSGNSGDSGGSPESEPSD